MSDLLNKLMRPSKLTPNVPPFERQVYNDGKRAVAPATPELRSLAQNIIDHVDEHRHLRHGRVLLLLESSEATQKKLTRGERVVIGRAYRASPIQRVLSSTLASETERRSSAKAKSDAERKLEPPLPGFDFIVKLSADWLDTMGFQAGEEGGIKSAIALIDHELLHCGVKIAGEFVPRKRLAEMVKNLKNLHVETCDDIQNEEGHILVRYQVRDEAGRYAWKLRPHDLEEFHGVVERWGAWDRAVGRLVDVLVNREKNSGTTQLRSSTASGKAARKQ